MRERVQDIECRFNSCKSILDSVTHIQPAFLLCVSSLPILLSFSLSFFLSLSLVSRVQVCESQQQLCASLSV